MKKFSNLSEAMAVVSAKNILIALAKDAHAELYFSKDFPCVNCHTNRGNFIMTSVENTLLHNIYVVTNWLAEQMYPMVGKTAEFLRWHEADEWNYYDPRD
jgi:hypothetical protein